MSADEEAGPVGVDQAEGTGIVTAGIAADVHHQHLHPFFLHDLHRWMEFPDFLPVAVAVNPLQWLETADLQGVFERSEIAGVPEFIDRFEKSLELVVEAAVGVGYQADVFHESGSVVADRRSAVRYRGAVLPPDVQR